MRGELQERLDGTLETRNVSGEKWDLEEIGRRVEILGWEGASSPNLERQSTGGPLRGRRHRKLETRHREKRACRLR